VSYSLWYNAPTMLLTGHRPAISWVHYTTSCNTQSSAPEYGQNNCPKHFEITGIINKPLLLHLLGCLYYLYQWCTVKQISGNEIYFLIKYIKIFLWGVAKRLSYIQDARCLKVEKSIKSFVSSVCFQHRYVEIVFLVHNESEDNPGPICKSPLSATGPFHLLESPLFYLLKGYIFPI